MTPRPERSRSLRSQALVAALCTLAPLATLGACKNDTPPEPVSAEPTATAPHLPSSVAAMRPRTPLTAPNLKPQLPGQPGRRSRIIGRPAASVAPSEDDPLKGKWSLAEAVKDVKGKGALLADIEVDIAPGSKPESTGTVTCALFEDKAPISVANFAGLARGIRPWKTPDGKWVKKPAYDGTIFHRIIKGFMIQGGDPSGNGSGEPGYVIPDEVWDDAYHDRPGLLCMANRGPNTNGAQFFITDAAAAHLDNRYTILGECAPVDLVHKIAGVEVNGERPATPPKIKKVTIRRGISPVATPAASASAGGSAAPSGAAPPPGASAQGP